MRAQPIRLSIPFWGDEYLHKVVNITLPALLAPGNLPALAEQFPVEVALVTESRLFDRLSESPAFQRLQKHADVRLTSLDDLLTNIRGDYGPVLTFALIRGYEDLGERMLEYFLMFLNADFVLADGSYRTVARLIREGHQVIHCPSFRAISEDVTPLLEQAVRKDETVLAIPPRELVALALRHKHITVKARVVNQRLCHQQYMDQLYWYVDDCTLIGYQWPVALVGLRPERVLTRPPLMFDYGFIPAICPTAAKYYISDSDECFMLEPEKRSAGQDQVRLGWTTPEAVARYLADYTTREQRECGEQMHVFHSADLPSNLAAVAAESRQYIRDITRRLGPPKPHENHPMLAEWWRGALARMEEARAQNADGRHRVNPASAAAGADKTNLPQRESALRSALKVGYRRLFGDAGRFRPTHPLWIETHLLSRAFADESSNGGRTLWVSSANHVLAPLARRADAWLAPADFKQGTPLSYALAAQVFDACFFDLSLMECLDFRKMYEQARPFVRNSGHIYLSVLNLRDERAPEDIPSFCDAALPDQDVSTVIFTGGAAQRRMRAMNFVANGPRFSNGVLRVGTLMVLAPLTYAVNRRALRRASEIYDPGWLSMFARFTVVRQERGLPDTVSEPRARAA